jgi:hypothetical protein
MAVLAGIVAVVIPIMTVVAVVIAITAVVAITVVASAMVPGHRRACSQRQDED